MGSLGHAVAGGAFWMLTLKLIERGIGAVSTVILARLLVPADFGIVSMAMAVLAFLAGMAAIGVLLALWYFVFSHVTIGWQ